MADVKVFRSEDVYLVCRGDVGRLVRPSGASAALPVGSILAHYHAAEPWTDVAREDWPAHVARVAAAMAAEAPEVEAPGPRESDP
jgi:hypothetical protein